MLSSNRQSSTTEQREQQQMQRNRQQRRNQNRPPPPIGMLSIQQYTDIACVLEFVVCTCIVSKIQPHILLNLHDRIKYQLPKSLAGRIPKSALLWRLEENESSNNNNNNNN